MEHNIKHACSQIPDALPNQNQHITRYDKYLRKNQEPFLHTDHIRDANPVK